MNKKNGFTLIELLIVMSVIAILIGMALPSFRGMQNEARKTKAQGDVRTIMIAVEAYYKDHSNMYPSESGYQSSLTASVPQIMPNLLYDPFGSTATTQYSFSLSTHNPSTSQYYVIYSVGINGNGSASVSTTGVVTASTDAIWASNGH